MGKLVERLKNKIIRRLGGFTIADMLAQPKQRCFGISSNTIKSLTVCHKFGRYAPEYTMPGWYDYEKKIMAKQLADKMLDENLIEFYSKKDIPDTMEIRAIVKIVVPEEI